MVFQQKHTNSWKEKQSDRTTKQWKIKGMKERMSRGVKTRWNVYHGFLSMFRQPDIPHGKCGLNRPESLEKLSERMSKDNPMRKASVAAKMGNSMKATYSKRPELLENMRLKGIERWKDEEWARICASHQARRPSNPEIYLDAILQLNFQKEWRYVGDGGVWIEGKNPDFINCNGKKEIIEYNGHWKHTKEKDDAKVEIYKKYGYRTLNLYPLDLKNVAVLIDKIRRFE